MVNESPTDPSETITCYLHYSSFICLSVICTKQEPFTGSIIILLKHSSTQSQYWYFTGRTLYLCRWRHRRGFALFPVRWSDSACGRVPFGTGTSRIRPHLHVCPCPARLRTPVLRRFRDGGQGAESPTGMRIAWWKSGRTVHSPLTGFLSLKYTLGLGLRSICQTIGIRLKRQNGRCGAANSQKSNGLRQTFLNRVNRRSTTANKPPQ